VIFKQRKSKQFKYKSKYQSDTIENPDIDVQSGWEELKNSRKRKPSIFSSPLVLVLFLIVIVVIMYVLGRYE